VVVPEASENQIEISIVDPVASMISIENYGLEYLATEVRN